MATASSRSADIRIATVLDIVETPSGKMVSMVDSDTATPFEVPLSAPGAVAPVPGDTWMLTREYGPWMLDRCLIMVSTEARPESTISAVLDALMERGLISPNFGTGTDPEAPHLAKIGQIRWFAYEPDPYWWPEADGSVVQRNQYRELGNKIDPGTSATFTLPLVPTLGGSKPYVCAR